MAACSAGGGTILGKKKPLSFCEAVSNKSNRAIILFFLD